MYLFKLSIKQKRFADEYIISGNIYESAIKAGYSVNYAKAQSHKLLDNVGISKFLEDRRKQLESEKIADMKEVFEFWTKTMRDDSEETRKSDRLKASEYIARANGVFLDKIQLEGNRNAPVKIVINGEDND